MRYSGLTSLSGRFFPLILLLVATGVTGCFPFGANNTNNNPKVRIASGPPLAWGGGEAAEYINRSKDSIYYVQPGDTLWAIAAVHGIEVESLAQLNRIDNTDQLRVGQRLRLTAAAPNQAPQQQQQRRQTYSSARQAYKAQETEEQQVAIIPKPSVTQENITPSKDGEQSYSPAPTEQSRPAKIPEISGRQAYIPPPPEGIQTYNPPSTAGAQAYRPPVKVEQPKHPPATKPKKSAPAKMQLVNNKSGTWKLPSKPPKSWDWPHKGRLISRFGRHGQRRNNGIDISVKVGDPVRAAADGVVAYADTGLPGYGKMILLRHGGSYMTAYGYVNQILVRRGQKISAGQRIALAGQSGRAASPRLHFEIRHRVKPLNPLRYLPKNK